MAIFSEMCEIIPGLLLGSAADAERIVREGADVLVPLASLDGSVWKTGFRGEILYYPIEDRNVLPGDVLCELVDRICERLGKGMKVGIFCAGGHGRTGYVAACVLARHGIRDPIGFLRREYSKEAVETEQQRNEVLSYLRGLRAEQIRTEGLGENFFEYRTYRGDEPYIFLNFSEWDADLAAGTVRILNELGFNVAYDRTILEGKLWSGDRSDAIEDCSLFVTMRSPCERYSCIGISGCEFAELLEKPIVTIETDEKMWEYCDDDGDLIGTMPSEPDFAEKCLKAFAMKGLVPAPEKPASGGGAGSRAGSFRKKKKEREWDLGVTYYENYGDDRRGYRNDLHINSNLRTRETWNSRREPLEKASDEEIYRAVCWKCIRFDLFTRSREMDYFPDSRDREFRRTLCTLGGKPVPEIKEEYEKVKKRIDDYWSSYPYMDEFEYIDSHYDD